MNIQDSKTEELITLWMESFGDTRREVTNFFETAYSPERFHTIVVRGKNTSKDKFEYCSQIAAALYWLEYKFGSEKIAYIYAASTRKEFRNMGLFRRLMEETHQILRDRDYSGVALVPGDEGLFSLYEKLGYKTTIFKPSLSENFINNINNFDKISAHEYEKLREKILPNSAIFPADYVLKYMETFASFFKNDSEIIAISKEDPTKILEHITNDILICDIPHGMFMPLKEGCPVPNYIGLDLG